MNDRQYATLIHAINHFGVEANIDKTVEERGELTTELSRRRYVRYFAMTRKEDGAKGRNGRPMERKGAEDNG